MPELFWQIAFCAAAVYIIYAEIGYLLLLWVIARFTKTPPPAGNAEPSITLLIAAYNEARIIKAKLENSLALDYPPGCLQILVASDCSTDGTDAIVSAYEEKGVQLVRSCPRQGKIAALRHAEPYIRGEIVVFTDADSMLNAGALRALARRFEDPVVGAISGREMRPRAAGAGKGKGEGLYNRIDTRIKMLENRIGNQVGVHGGIFAMRRALMPYVPDHLSHDAIVPLRLVLSGYRVLYEPAAISTEAYDLDTAQDFRRRIRTVLQSIQSYLYVKDALNPLRTGFYALQILSHRFSRWLILPAMAIALTANAFLLNAPLYRLGMIAQAIFYCLCLAGWAADRLGRHPTLLYFPFYFVYIHIAAFYAVLLHLSGQKITTWRPTPREAFSQN